MRFFSYSFVTAVLLRFFHIFFVILDPFWKPKWCLGAERILLEALPKRLWGALRRFFCFFDSSGVPKGGQDEPKVAKMVPK